MKIEKTEIEKRDLGESRESNERSGGGCLRISEIWWKDWW